MAGHRIAVVGATGAAGEMTLRILEERKFPVRELRAFASERSVGKSVTFAGDPIRVEKVTPEAFRGVEIAFFSAGTAQSKEHAPLAVRAGAVVVDKSNAFRMDPAVPLVVPEINAHAVRGHQGIVASPNCTTVVTVMALAPLHRAARVPGWSRPATRRCRARASRGVEELRAADARVGARRGDHPELLPAPDRLQPHPAHRQVRSRRLHRRGVEAGQRGPEDPRGPDMPISPTTVRVPVFTAHSVAVNAETAEKVTVERARELFGRFPGLRVLDDPEQARYPMPVTVEGQDDCVVGRIREDLSSERGLNFWVVGDQLRKGAATNAVQIAELLGGATPSR